MIAKGLHSPAFALDKEEAQMLAAGIADVSQHYSVVVDPKTLAWINLSGVLFAVYGSRVLLLFAGKGAQKKGAPVQQEQTAQSSNVMSFDPSQLPPIRGVNN